MEATNVLSKFSSVIADLGLAGMVIAILITSNVALWKMLKERNTRIASLVDRMLTMSERANTMIERITGRSS